MKTSRAVLVCLVFTGIGLVMALTSGGENRIVGLTCALLFGSAALMGVGKLRRERNRKTAEAREAMLDATGQAEAGFVIARRSPRDPLQMVGTAGICVAGIGIFVYADAFDEDDAVLQFAGLVIATLMGGLFVANLFRRAGLVVKIVSGGILWITDKPRLIPWDAVTGGALFNYNGNAMLGLRVANPRQLELTTFTKLGASVNRVLMHWDLAITADQLSSDPLFIEWLIYHLHQNGAERRLVGSDEGLQELQSRWSEIAPKAPPLPGHA